MDYGRAAAPATLIELRSVLKRRAKFRETRCVWERRGNRVGLKVQMKNSRSTARAGLTLLGARICSQSCAATCALDSGFDCFSGRLWRPDGRAHSTRGTFEAALHFLHSDYASASQATLDSCASKPPLLRLLQGESWAVAKLLASVSTAQLVSTQPTWPAAYLYLQNITQHASQKKKKKKS